MVFCYKIITESPRRSLCTSPRKLSPIRCNNLPSAVSELVNTFDYEEYGSVLDSIPEREWRLLGALAKKREEDDEREQLAEQFQRMWMEEKQEREIAEAETTEQYKKYIHNKREQERTWMEYKRLQRGFEQQVKRGQLIDCIRYKERKSADLLACRDDRKVTELVDKAVEEEARMLLAADRRDRLGAAQEWSKRIQLVDTQKRASDANRRRSARLRDASQKVAISNALSSWESRVLRQEVEASEAMKRASTAALVASKHARMSRLARQRDVRRVRARKLAAATARMRDIIKGIR